MFNLYFVANHVFVDICFEIYFTNMQLKMYFSFWRFIFERQIILSHHDTYSFPWIMYNRNVCSLNWAIYQLRKGHALWSQRNLNYELLLWIIAWMKILIHKGTFFYQRLLLTITEQKLINVNRDTIILQSHLKCWP